MNITAYYPLWVYTVKIRYKLLSELGEISHLLLKSLNDYQLSLSDISSVMGLSADQLKPIVERLKGLGLLHDKDEKISDQGKILVFIAKHIHDQELTLAIDRHYGDKGLGMLLIPENSECLETIPTEALELAPPPYARRSHAEDLFNQTERFRRNLSNLGPKLIPEFDEILPHLNKKGAGEWDVKIDSRGKGKGVCINVPVKPYSKSTNQTSVHLSVATPALVLKTQFSHAKGISWGQDESVAIEPLHSIYSMADDDFYDDDFTVLELEKEGYSLVLEEPLSNDTLLAKELLRHSVLRMSELDDEYPILSIQHDFFEAWQEHKYSYKELLGYLEHPDIVRVE